MAFRFVPRQLPFSADDLLLKVQRFRRVCSLYFFFTHLQLSLPIHHTSGPLSNEYIHVVAYARTEIRLYFCLICLEYDIGSHVGKVGLRLK